MQLSRWGVFSYELINIFVWFRSPSRSPALSPFSSKLQPFVWFSCFSYLRTKNMEEFLTSSECANAISNTLYAFGRHLQESPADARVSAR